MDEFMKFNTLDIIIVVLTGVDAAVLQVVDVARLPEGLGLRPPRLPGERARERHGVELGGAALERPLAQAHLFAVAPRGHVVELAVVVALQFMAKLNSFCACTLTHTRQMSQNAFVTFQYYLII